MFNVLPQSKLYWVELSRGEFSWVRAWLSFDNVCTIPKCKSDKSLLFAVGQYSHWIYASCGHCIISHQSTEEKKYIYF